MNEIVQRLILYSCIYSTIIIESWRTGLLSCWWYKLVNTSIKIFLCSLEFRWCKQLTWKQKYSFISVHYIQPKFYLHLIQLCSVIILSKVQEWSFKYIYSICMYIVIIVIIDYLYTFKLKLILIQFTELDAY